MYARKTKKQKSNTFGNKKKMLLAQTAGCFQIPLQVHSTNEPLLKNLAMDVRTHDHAGLLTQGTEASTSNQL
jgi:hypothetical protein